MKVFFTIIFLLLIVCNSYGATFWDTSWEGTPGSANFPCKAIPEDCTMLTFDGFTTAQNYCREQPEIDYGLLSTISSDHPSSATGSNSYKQVQPQGIGDSCAMYREFGTTTNTKFYFRFYLYWPTIPNSTLFMYGDGLTDTSMHFIGFSTFILDVHGYGNGNCPGWGYYGNCAVSGCGNTTGAYFLLMESGSTLHYQDDCFNLQDHFDEWICFEWMLDFQNDKVAKWVNGVQTIGTGGNGVDCPLSATSLGSTDSFKFYSTRSGADQITDCANTYYIDNIAIGNSYIGLAGGGDTTPPVPVILAPSEHGGFGGGFINR